MQALGDLLLDSRIDCRKHSRIHGVDRPRERLEFWLESSQPIVVHLFHCSQLAPRGVVLCQTASPVFSKAVWVSDYSSKRERGKVFVGGREGGRDQSGGASCCGILRSRVQGPNP